MKPSNLIFLRAIVLLVCGALLTMFFYWISDASPAFEQGTVGKTRPIVEVLTWFGFAFAAYLTAWIAVGGFSSLRRQPTSPGVDPLTFNILNPLVVLAFAIVFRIVMTPSVPIQEIDLYRYIWDGAVVSNHLDPYQFGPKTVLDAVRDESLIDRREGLDDYVGIVEERPGLKRVLEITHFGEFTTPYPPVSQAAFGLAVAAVEPDGNAKNYVFAMKTMLVAFDLLTGVLIMLLLYHLRMNPSLALGYLWCPLVIKEIANGGHLDSIATFLAVLAIYFTTCALWNPKQLPDPDADPADEKNNRKNRDADEIESPLPAMSLLTSSASAIALAAAFSAKVFPIVIAPIWFIVMFRRSGPRAIIFALLFCAAAYGFSYPMLRHLESAQRRHIVPKQTYENEAFQKADQSGIEAFSKYWEMNDFLFMLAVENIKPVGSEPDIDIADYNNPAFTPWFAVTTNNFRNKVVEKARVYFEDAKPSEDSEEKPRADQHTPSHFAFFATRSLTVGIFGLIVAWACLYLLIKPTSVNWLEMAFLMTAWFWLVSPTQNPWYWTWSIPLLVFARGRVWVLLSGTLFAYYLRFWFEYQFVGTDVMGFWKAEHGTSFWQDVLFPFSDQYAYQSTRFFDLYIPVLEFGPWFVLLFLFAVLGCFSRWRTA